MLKKLKNTLARRLIDNYDGSQYLFDKTSSKRVKEAQTNIHCGRNQLSRFTYCPVAISSEKCRCLVSPVVTYYRLATDQTQSYFFVNNQGETADLIHYY